MELPERDSLGLAMFAAWLNVRVDQIPAENRIHTSPDTMAAWDRVAKAAICAMLDGVEPVADALRPFAECVEQVSAEESDEEWAKFRLLIGDYRRAAKALYSLDALKEAL